jgi:hypothetical protein
MGFVRKITGVQGQIDAANRNTDAQLAASKQAADAEARAAQVAAQSVADQQRLTMERQAASEKAAKLNQGTLQTADVQLQQDQGGQVAVKRRSAFGRVLTGVQI